MIRPLTCSRELPGSNLRRDTNYPDRGFSLFSLVPPGIVCGALPIHSFYFSISLPILPFAAMWSDMLTVVKYTVNKKAHKSLRRFIPSSYFHLISPKIFVFLPNYVSYPLHRSITTVCISLNAIINSAVIIRMLKEVNLFL